MKSIISTPLRIEWSGNWGKNQFVCSRDRIGEEQPLPDGPNDGWN
jgi:hypothetical protein